MPKKRKQKTDSLADLHFTSSLQLEQAVYVMGNLADDSHHVTLTEVGTNQFRFEITYYEEEQQAAIKGTLKRWHGTETKLDASGSVATINSEENNAQGSMISGLFIVSIGILAASVTGSLWIVLPFFLSGVGVRFIGIKTLDEENYTHTVDFRKRDYLLQLLIDTYQAAGDVQAI